MSGLFPLRPRIMIDIDDVLASLDSDAERVAWLRQELGEARSLADGWGGLAAWDAFTRRAFVVVLDLMKEAGRFDKAKKAKESQP